MSIVEDDMTGMEALDAEAAEWFLRIEREEPALETLAAWQRWMELAPSHRAAYEATQRAWSALDGVSPVRWTVVDAPGVRRRAWTRMWPIAATVTLAAVGALLAVRWYDAGAYRTTIKTVVAEHRELNLPDHSRVLVGAHSTVKVKLSAQAREVRLVEGEAYFTVAPDAARPFVVVAGSSKVTALGTAFNLRKYGDAVAVEVAEGRVRIESAAPRQAGRSEVAVLGRGEETVMHSNGAMQPVRDLPSENVSAWRSGRRSYIDQPLSLVIADLNRYAGSPVTFEDPALGELRVTTTLINNDWQGWLRTLESAVPTLKVNESSGSVRISAR